MNKKTHSRSEVIVTLSLVFFIVFSSGMIIYKGLKIEEKEIILDLPEEGENKLVLDNKDENKSDETKAEKEGVEEKGDEEVGGETKDREDKKEEWREIYSKTKSIKIGGVVVEASIASTIPEQILGLSNTPYLPEKVVKFFMFDVDSDHPIWMKDMNYSIDIIWVNKAGEIVFVKEDVSPETYPEAFYSPTLARYVIETKAGFFSKNNLKVGDKVTLVSE